MWSAPKRAQDVGHFVAAVRRRNGRTQAQLAHDAGVPRRFVNELETGHTTMYLERLVAVLHELGVRVRLEAGSISRPSTQPTVRFTALAEGDITHPVKDLGW